MGLKDRFETLTLKNKIFLSTLCVILLLSVAIALDTRLVLVSSLTTELKMRGIAIAQSVAEQGRSYIVTADRPRLVALAFDAAQLRERRKFIAYIFVTDKQDRLLAHTFMRPFPGELRGANRFQAEGSTRPYHIELVRTAEGSVYDIAVPVLEGIYQIGTVHVGLSKSHIDLLIGKLAVTFLGIIAGIILVFFFISHRLASYITRPIAELTRISDRISKGQLNLEEGLANLHRCWAKMKCQRSTCPAYGNDDYPRWNLVGTECSDGQPFSSPAKMQFCAGCDQYAKRAKDEVGRLADSFLHMTQRLRESQRRLQESEIKYRSLFAAGPAPIFVLDRGTLRILDVNPRAEEVYGYHREELLERNFTEVVLLGDENGENVFPGSSQGSDFSAEVSRVRHYKQGGEPFYVNVHVGPARYGEREAFIVAVTDITEVVEKEAQLIQASKMSTLGQMSAGIAHELNQPLNAIKMGSDFLEMMVTEEREIPGRVLRQVVGEMNRQVDRASEIIGRLREFGRKSEPTRERVDLNQSVRDVRVMLGTQLGLQNISLSLELTPAPLYIMAQKNRIEQVLINLLTNARDAVIEKAQTGLGGNGRIAVRSFREGNRAVLEVADTGVGIPQHLKDHIFEPFMTTKGVGKGMGLGLSIAYGIVRDYGGDISFQSSPSGGTVFRLSFPEIQDGRGAASEGEGP